MATLIQIRRDTQANWTTNNPVLASGEIAFSTDQNKIKIGNGSSSWSQLDYINVLPSELDSDNISEGTTNLFFTPERAIDAVAAGDFNTDVVEEGTLNLYYTDARVEDVISNSSTDNVSEGTANLYFTEQRAIDAVVENISVDDLSDVDSSEPSDGDILIYSTTTQTWTPGVLTVIDGGTP